MLSHAAQAASFNNGMHPTRDTMDFINSKGACGRVMPGVSAHNVMQS
jgi:hypothetical protein